MAAAHHHLHSAILKALRNTGSCAEVTSRSAADTGRSDCRRAPGGQRPAAPRPHTRRKPAHHVTVPHTAPCRRDRAQWTVSASRRGERPGQGLLPEARALPANRRDRRSRAPAGRSVFHTVAGMRPGTRPASANCRTSGSRTRIWLTSSSLRMTASSIRTSSQILRRLSMVSVSRRGNRGNATSPQGRRAIRPDRIPAAGPLRTG